MIQERYRKKEYRKMIWETYRKKEYRIMIESNDDRKKDNNEAIGNI